MSTESKKINAFFQRLTREGLRNGESFVAVLEACGFNHCVICMLRDYRCHKVILIQPDDRKKCKADERATDEVWSGVPIGFSNQG